MASRPYIDILFGPYLPDLGGVPNPQMPGYLVDALNVRSTPNGYRGMPTFANVTSATAIGASAVNYGVGACFYTQTTTHFFVVLQGSGNGVLWESRAEGTDTWEDLSTGIGVTLSAFGDFFRFGDEVVYTSAPQGLLVSKDLTDAHATNFASIADSATGTTGARVGQHAVVGGGLSGLYTVRTSAIGDHTDWPTPGTADARSKQSISEDLDPEFGEIRRIVGGEKIGIIIQDYALTRMTYVGGSAVYKFEQFFNTSGHGTRLFSRPIRVGQLWHFYNEDGVFATDGYSVLRISEGKVDEALFTNSISHPNGASLEDSHTGVYDSKRGLIIFGGGENDGGSRYQLTANPTAGNFALTNDEEEIALFSGYEEGTDAVYGLQRTRNIYCVNQSDRKLRKLTGATGTIALQTGYIELEPGYRVQIQRAHLLGADVPGSLTLSYKTAATLNDVDTLQTGFTAMTAVSRGEGAAARTDAPYVAFRVTGTGAESQLIRGIRIFYERSSPI